ncbi:Zinc finger GRF-type [Trinorchestia longiramus]|nr:Zinc finger GRF-type [Trinorchestia longiramus]
MQETKITRDMLTEDLALIQGYTSYFSFSRKRSGYSGVATYVKESCTPVYACEGLCGTLMPEMKASTSINQQKVSAGCKNMALVIAAASSPLLGEWAKQTLKDIDNEGRTVITVHNLVPTDEADDLPQKSDPVPLAIINVYCPRVDPERADRGLYKLQFYRALRLRAAMLAEAGARVVIVGDLNTSHQKLDHCDPDEEFHLNPGRKFLDALLLKPQNQLHVTTDQRDSGNCSSEEFSRCEKAITCADENYSDVNSPLEETNHTVLLENSCETGNRSGQCVDWTDHGNSENQIADKDNPPSFVKTAFDGSQDGENTTDPLMDLKIYREFRMVDTFRSLYPKKKDAFSCWNMKVSARSTNYGTRIDYVLCDKLFFLLVADSLVLQDVMGSDHCPVSCICRAGIIPADKLPQLCSKNFVEFQGEQLKIFSYFQKINPADTTQNVTAITAGNGKCVTSKHSGETLDSLKKNKCFDSFFVKNDIKARECDSQDSSQSYGSLMCKRATHFNSPLGEKRKKSFRNDGIKNKQSKLISFFASSNVRASPSKSMASVTHELRTNSQPDAIKSVADGVSPSISGDSRKLSLYEAELKYLKENPEIYKELNLRNDGEINMDVLTKTENGEFGEKIESGIESVPDSNFRTHDSNVEQSVPSTCDRGMMSSNLNFSSENHTDMSCASNKLVTSQSDDGHTSTFTLGTSVGKGSLGEPMGATQRGRNDKEIDSPSVCLNSSKGLSCSRSTADWSFFGKNVVPLCPGHKEPSVLRTSKKKGVNFNRKFYACARGAGRPGQKDAQCNFFKWA